MPDVGVVLDTSAVLAYAAGAERVGLFVALLADRGEAAVIPATCLAAAYREVDLTAWDLVDLLASHPHVTVARWSTTSARCSATGPAYSASTWRTPRSSRRPTRSPR